MQVRSVLWALLSILVPAMAGLCHSAQPVANGHPIVIGERFEIHSQATGETRSYLVHRPSDYDLSSARYPLLVVLDGGGDFQHASTTADLLADAGQIPSMLVVGIPNTDRNRDLVPYVPHSGSENFLRFVTTELIPKLDHDFRTLPYRILVGHSYGGLFGLYSLIQAPVVFRGYILASPTLEGDNRGLPGTVGSFLEQHQELAASVYLTTANENGEFLSGNWELSAYLQRQASRDQQLFLHSAVTPRKPTAPLPCAVSMMDWSSFFRAGRLRIHSPCMSRAALRASTGTMRRSHRASDFLSQFPKG